VPGTVLPPIADDEVPVLPVVPAVMAPVVPPVGGAEEEVAPAPPVPVIGTEPSTALGTWGDMPPLLVGAELPTTPGSEICPLAQAPCVITDSRRTVDRFRIGLG
jgi:hypothetical protein